MARAYAGVVALSFAGVLLQVTGLVLFVLGFFPVKPALTGIRHPFAYLSVYISELCWENSGTFFLVDARNMGFRMSSAESHF